MNLAYLNIINRKMVALLKLEEEEDLDPLDWKIAGEHIYNMKCCLVVCFVFVLIIEMGFYNFLVRPLIEPIKLYGGHYIRAL